MLTLHFGRLCSVHTLSFMCSWPPSAHSRHLQKEMENQTAQVGCYQQRKQKVEEDIRKNEDLLKKAHVEQKKTQVNQTAFCHRKAFLDEVIQSERRRPSPLPLWCFRGGAGSCSWS